MKNMMKEAPEVAQSFFDLAKSVREYSPLGRKIDELIILGIFTAHRGLRGINTHVERALEAGATKEEIIAAILLALPIVGITDTNLALDEAVIHMEAYMSKQEVPESAAH